jgi:hypothetical protein
MASELIKKRTVGIVAIPASAVFVLGIARQLSTTNKPHMLRKMATTMATRTTVNSPSIPITRAIVLIMPTTLNVISDGDDER